MATGCSSSGPVSDASDIINEVTFGQNSPNRPRMSGNVSGSNSHSSTTQTNGGIATGDEEYIIQSTQSHSGRNQQDQEADSSVLSHSLR